MLNSLNKLSKYLNGRGLATYANEVFLLTKQAGILSDLKEANPELAEDGNSEE